MYYLRTSSAVANRCNGLQISGNLSQSPSVVEGSPTTSLHVTFCSNSSAFHNIQMPLPPLPLTAPRRISSSADVTLSSFFSKYLDDLALGAGSATASYYLYPLDEKVALEIHSDLYTNLRSPSDEQAAEVACSVLRTHFPLCSDQEVAGALFSIFCACLQNPSDRQAAQVVSILCTHLVDPSGEKLAQSILSLLRACLPNPADKQASQALISILRTGPSRFLGNWSTQAFCILPRACEPDRVLSPSPDSLDSIASSSVEPRNHISSRRLHILPLNDRHTDPTTPSHPVFRNVNDLTTHHGIPTSLPPTPPRRTSSLDKTTPSSEDNAFSSLCSKYLNMLTNPTSEMALNTTAQPPPSSDEEAAQTILSILRAGMLDHTLS